MSDDFKERLREIGITQKQFADLIGLSYHTVRKQLCYGGKRGVRRIVPTWAKAFLLGFELGKGAEKKSNADALK